MLGVLGWTMFALVQIVGLQSSIFGYHSFRQTQTALSIRSMLQGGPLLYYETPVYGPPWAVPLEFPLYQWICAGVVKLLGTPIDPTSRAISAVFGAGCIVLLPRILAVLGRPVHERRLIVVFGVFSPVLMFWSHSVLIETCSLFLALLWLERTLRWMQEERTSRKARSVLFLCALLIGVLGGLVKVTTLVPAVVFCGLLYLRRARAVIRGLRDGGSRANTVIFELGSLGLLAAPLIAGHWWSKKTEGLRLLNDRDAVPSGASIRRQMFGTLRERTDFDTTLQFVVRTIDHSLGSTLIVLTIAVAGSFAVLKLRGSPKEATAGEYASGKLAVTGNYLVMAAVGAVIATVSVLFHVHVAHDYYGVEIAPYLLVAVVVGIGIVQRQVRPIGALLLPLVVIGASIVTYGQFYRPKDLDPMSFHPELRRAVGKAFQVNDVIVLRGTVYDPSVGYFVNRRIVVQGEVNDDIELQREFERLVAAGYRAGMIQCGWIPAEIVKRLEHDRRRNIGSWNGCTVFAPPS